MELDRCKYVISLLFDLSKAFDSVSKEHLKEKIYAMGIRGITCDWMLSYMSERKLQVKADNIFSWLGSWCTSGICSRPTAIFVTS
nr:unnamed protein product [Callosobruchus analis]